MFRLEQCISMAQLLPHRVNNWAFFIRQTENDLYKNGTNSISKLIETIKTAMETTTNNEPDLSIKRSNSLFNKYAWTFGLALGVLTVLYIVILNLATDSPSTGLRFAKHLLIIPIVWIAISSYSNQLSEGKALKSELGLLLRLGLWAGGVIAILNILFFGLVGTSFEQFIQEGDTLAGVLINSGFLVFETLVFVMIIGFVILLAYKGKGSPED